MNRFEPHAHDHYSNIRLLDCINRPKELIDRAIEIGLAGIAITNHDCLSSHIELNQYAKEIAKEHPNFKVALGNEIYLCENREKNQKYYHFILIAKNKIGHRALRELSSRAWMNSYYDRGMERVVTTYNDLYEIVNKYPNSLIATTACLGGELSTLTLNMINAEATGDEYTKEKCHNRIVEFIQFCQRLFGEDFYIECAPGCSREQILVNKRLVSIAECFNIKMVIGTDAHYLKKEDRFVHKAYLTSKPGDREVDDFYEYSYLQTEDEIKENMQKSIPYEVERMFKNSMEIYDKIEYYSLEHKQTIPKVEVKDYPKSSWWGVNNSDADDMSCYPVLKSMFTSDDKVERYWVNQCWEALEEKVGPWHEHLDYVARLEEEADTKRVIGGKLETNMFSYPVTLQHYVDLFWECGSIVGAGRGSSCSGLNHWLLGVTQLDPIKWNFPWFRYMNKERVELGDVDLDLNPSKRPTILKAIKKERGQKFKADIDDLSRKNLGCTLIATFGTEGTRSTILTACFKEGTLVKTKFGEKKIEEIVSGDEVWTINGWEKVINPTYLSDKTLIRLKTRNSTNDYIDCTDDHEFLVVSKEHKGRIAGKFNKQEVVRNFKEFEKYKSTDSFYQRVYGYYRFVEPYWKKAKDIDSVNDYGIKKIDLTISDEEFITWKNEFKNNFGVGISEKIFINEDLCELVGIWLAEGSSNGSQLTFTINKQEGNFRDRIIQLMWNIFRLDNYSIYERKESQALNISYSSKQLIKFFESLFEVKDLRKVNQWNKYIPNKLKYIEPKLQMQIFKGWFIGDGYATNPQADKKEAKGTTVSKQLADDIIFILNRNFINPFIRKEERANKAKAYNIMFYQDKARSLYKMKYLSNDYSETFNFKLKEKTEMDFPLVWNNEYYLKTKIEKAENVDNNNIKQNVYCLQVPSQSFTVNDCIVHNCRGYRSEEYPDGIDNDTAQYMSSLIPSERGFLWPLNDVVNGNKDKDRKPINAFINEVKQYDGLLDIMMAIEGLVNKRSSHASGVILFDEDPYEFGCFMKTPKGEIITQYDLHDCEYVGMTKYDLLVTEVCDKITQTIKLLQDDGVIEKDLSLREIYNKYLHPNALPLDDKEVWKNIQEGSVLNLFQLDSIVGAQAAKKIKPINIQELADCNGLMRLMTAEKGEESPIDKYVRFKNNIDLWYEEMRAAGLPADEQEILKPYFLSSYGVPPSQEQLMLMLMDKNICNFTLAEANAARKIVGKKLMSKIPELKEKVLNQAKNKKLGLYIWRHGVGPQMGYSFSIIHATAYSIIGFQTAYLATQWNPIYWNTACLIINSGSLEEDSDIEIIENDLEEKIIKKEKGSDYAKIAKALGDIISRGIKVSLVNINKSNYTFEPDIENNQILFGMKALSNVGTPVIEQIIENRPYKNFYDFLNKCPLNKTAMISLIKSGAFDELEIEWAKKLNIEPRYLIMAIYISKTCDAKKKLTLQNFAGLIKKNLIPDELFFQKEVFLFNKYLKTYKKVGKYFVFNQSDEEFYNKYFDLEKLEIINGLTCILQTTWDKIYKKEMDAARDWLKNNQQKMLKEFNNILFYENWNKYAKGNISAWEMESLCFYYHDHELAHVNIKKYGINDFFDMPEEPIVDYFFKRNNKNIPIYKTYKIIGTVISKNDPRSSISILTTKGVVNVKFTKEYFAMIGRQISELQDDGTKKIKEKSWLTRGTKLLINGFRREDTFVAKAYKSSSTHTVYKITDLTKGGNLVLTHTRYGQNG